MTSFNVSAKRSIPSIYAYDGSASILNIVYVQYVDMHTQCTYMYTCIRMCVGIERGREGSACR